MHNTPLAHAYRREGDWSLIELKLKSLNQLFNLLDPAPFLERDLDDTAASYLMDSIRELHGAKRVKIRIHLPSEAPAQTEIQIREILQHYFSYREQAARHKLRLLLRQGRLSLLIGLAFLTLCMTVSDYLSHMQGLSWNVFGEGFLILGWVALWRPLEIFLYDWWAPWGEARLCKRLAGLPVELESRESL